MRSVREWRSARSPGRVLSEGVGSRLRVTRLRMAGKAPQTTPDPCAAQKIRTDQEVRPTKVGHIVRDDYQLRARAAAAGRAAEADVAARAGVAAGFDAIAAGLDHLATLGIAA